MRLRIALAGFVGLLVAAQGSLAQPLTVPEDGAFDNLGVNPNLVGAWLGEDPATGPVTGLVNNNGTMVFVHLDEAGQILTHNAQFTSWQCTGPGEFISTLVRQVRDAYGNVLEEEERCEIGTLTRDGLWGWANTHAPDCPPKDTPLVYQQLLNTSLSTVGQELACP